MSMAAQSERNLLSITQMQSFQSATLSVRQSRSRQHRNSLGMYLSDEAFGGEIRFNEWMAPHQPIAVAKPLFGGATD